MKYRKKPVTIEAFQWYRGMPMPDTPQWFQDAVAAGTVEYNVYGRVVIHTLEGAQVSQEHDYIIRGVKSELYPCKPDIFSMTYELVE